VCVETKRKEHQDVVVMSWKQARRQAQESLSFSAQLRLCLARLWRFTTIHKNQYQLACCYLMLWMTMMMMMSGMDGRSSKLAEFEFEVSSLFFLFLFFAFLFNLSHILVAACCLLLLLLLYIQPARASKKNNS